ncbi:MAG: DUF4339 domain-containing protein [Planctomycetaceae bacterium]
MEFVVLWIICGAIAAAIAHHKGRSAIGWFFMGFFFSLIGIVIVAVLPNVREEQERQRYLDRENRRLREQLNQERVKSESFRQYASQRLDTHDRHLGVDTHQAPTALPGGQPQRYLDDADDSDDFLHSLGLHEQESDEFPPARDVEADRDAEVGRAAPLPNHARPAEGTGRRQWHYEEHGEVRGPITERALLELLRSGELDASTQLWTEELGDWKAANEIGALRRLFS